MNSRELSAEQVKIHLTADDIAKIKNEASPRLPFNREAFEAIQSGLSVRGTGMNIFVSGSSAAERERLIRTSIGYLKPGDNRSTIIRQGDHTDKHLKAVQSDSAVTENGERLILRGWERPPVIFEHNPVIDTLFGKKTSDISELSAGSILSSNGGLLVICAEDILAEKESWKQLKRVLRSGKLSIGQDPSVLVDADIKLAILGNEPQYDLLYDRDEDFRELFQFYAEIDTVIDLNESSLANTVNCLRNFTADTFKRTLSDEAALELIKYSISAAENKKKLSTVLSDLEIIIREASDEAVNTAGPVSGDDIRSTLTRQAARFSLLEQRIIEEMKSGEIVIHLDGSCVGKVNGLAVMDKGPWAFGSPGLISATIAPGENGLVNIEHEAGLSGEIHDKWVLILEAFLRSRFAHDFPISIFASICFEQSYSEIDGDSASSSELYALLSAISGVPLRQDIAVTGSLSQTGEIQAVGGLREKIEGFYKVCKAINFTGTQGVIVPERNIDSIILPDHIIDDIRNGRFHIYTVSTVDDSMKLLTGKDTGERNARGQFPPGTLNSMVEKNLKKIAGQVKNFGS